MSCLSCAKPSVDTPPTIPSFTTVGEVGIINSGNSNFFVDFAYSVPFLASAADAYITSLLSNEIIIGLEPSYFQVPYIYSCCSNLINGNYTSTVDDQGDIVVTIYQIPYKTQVVEKTANIVTYFNKQTNILFYEVPREFTYNSVDQASLAFIEFEDGSFKGTLLIPSSFVSNVDTIEYKLTFTISVSDVINAIPSIRTGDLPEGAVCVIGAQCTSGCCVGPCQSIQCALKGTNKGVCSPYTGPGSSYRCRTSGSTNATPSVATINVQGSATPSDD